MNRITLDDERDFLLWRPASGRTVEITDIAVGSERRKGKGRALVQHLLRHLAGSKVSLVYAITRWGNGIAQCFYEALGFRVVGRLHGFYRDGGAVPEHGVMYGLDI